MKKLFLLYLFLIFSITLPGQCPLLLDGNLNFSSEPYWVFCGGSDFQLTLQTDRFVGDYTVDWGDGSPIESGTSFDETVITVNHLYLATVDTFILIFTPDPINFPGCEITGVVVIEERTTAEIGIPGGIDLSICAPGIFSYVNNSNTTSMKPISETTIFTWDFGDGSPPVSFDYTNTGQTVSHEYLPNTTGCGVFVELTAENYCGLTTAIFGPINIWDLDTADITPSATILCYPDTIFTFYNTTRMNCQPDNSAQRFEYWNLGDYWGLGYDSIIPWSPWPPTPPWTLGFPGPGVYTVMLLDSSFCGIDTTYETVFITLPPDVDLTIDPDTICVGQSTQFNGIVLDMFPDVFWWNFGDGSGWQTLVPGIQNHTYMIPGDYIIQFVGTVSSSSSGCADTASVMLHVQPAPIPDIIASEIEGCDSLIVTFTDNSSAGAVSWDWDFANGNTSIEQNPEPQNYDAPGIYNVSLSVTSTNGCINYTNILITIYESPTANFIASNVCEGGISNFVDLSSFPPNDTIISWYWNFGDGNTSIEKNPTNIFNSSGIFNVGLTVTTAHCSNTIIYPINVEPKPIISFYPEPDEGCTMLNVQFINTTTGATNYAWDFGDDWVSAEENPEHAFINVSATEDTIYTIQLIASTVFGCRDTAYNQVTVYPGSHSDFSVGPVPDCAPSAVSFSNTTINGFSYEWNFGDGTPVSNEFEPTHVFSNTTLFTINYTVSLVSFSTNGCTDTSYQLVFIHPQMILDIPDEPVIGCSPLTVNFPQSADDGAVAWFWDFDDGDNSNEQSPVHTYVNNTTDIINYEVMLIAMNGFGCIDTAYLYVTVKPMPVAQFTANPISQVYPEATISILDLTVGNNTFYLWTFDDGTISSDPDISEYTYDTWGSYNITLNVEDAGCYSVYTQTVVILPPVPIADYDIEAKGCVPVTVDFINTSLYADSYIWDFGDGGQSNLENPTYVYHIPGAYNVALTALGAGGQNTVIYLSTVEVYPQTFSFFTASTDIVYIPNDQVLFYNLSENATEYFWDFGDGVTSTYENPVHYYTEEGLYTITLTTNNKYDCPDIYTIENMVKAEASGNLLFPNAFTPNPDFGNGGTYNPTDPSQNLNDVFHPIYSGIVEYQLWVYNRWGELLFESNDILIGWDGYYKNVLSKQDVYVWKVKAVTARGVVINQTGDLTLVR